MRLGRRALLWLGIYLLLVLLPMMVALIDPPVELRGFVVESGVMFGFLGLGMLGAQVIISGRHSWFAPELGLDNVLQFHRRIGTLAVLIMLGDPRYLAYLDPREDLLRAASLVGLTMILLFIVVSSLWRLSLGLSYEVWRLLHGVFTGLLLLGVLGHALMAGHYTGSMVSAALLVGLVLVPLYLLVDSRLFRLFRLRRKPWRVTSNKPERNGATSLTVTAVGHEGMSFLPGQFFWITLGDSPFSLQQHPFSFASSSWTSASLADALPLRVIHVLAEPPDDWTGESGLVDADLLARCLPPDSGGLRYYICGPEPLMDAAEKGLMGQGVHPAQIYSDRFNLV